MSIIYEAKVRQTRWLAGAEVVFDLRIENLSDAPFETPDPMYRTSTQPYFELTGPDELKREFRPNSRATEWDQNQPPTVLRLAPGQHWEGDMLLSQYSTPETPGRYLLRSWIENNGMRIESPPAEFEVVRLGTRDLAVETSVGENDTTVVGCVELMDGGEVAGSTLRELDPRNAELRPFNRIERGKTAPEAAAIHAPYANFSVGLSVIRWIIAEQGRKLTVGHSLTEKRIRAFDGDELARILPPVATEAALYLAAVRGSELVLERIPAQEDTVEAGTVSRIERLSPVPDAATLTLSPPGAGSTLLFVLAWNAEKETRVQFLTVSASGKVLGRAEQTIAGVRPLGASAAGWSSTGDVRAALLVRSATQATEIRAAEIRLSPTLTIDGAPRLSDPVRLEFPLQDAQLAYFEQQASQLNRILLVRTTDGRIWVIPGDGPPRAPYTQFPATGPLAMLPGRIWWYAVWPSEGKLAIGPL